MPNTKKLIVVLGAHRSGTSLCAAAVECLGADLGMETLYANEENRKGFFEHPEVVEFNDRLLHQLGGSWDNPLFNGPEAISHAELTSWRSDATQLITRLFGDIDVAALKDPRMCQLIDFWVPVFDACGYGAENIFFVHTLRDPVEVALSQQQRAERDAAFYEIGRELKEGAALWMSLTAQALLQAKHLNNYFILYQDLLERPRIELEALASFLRLTPDNQRIDLFCSEFVDSSLHRSIQDSKSRAVLDSDFPQIFEFHRALEALRHNNPGSTEDIDRALAVFQRPDTQTALYDVIPPALSRLSDSCREDRLQVKYQGEVIDNLDRQIQERDKKYTEFEQAHLAVLKPLRSEVVTLHEGNCALQEQLHAASEEYQRLHTDHRYMEGRLHLLENSISWQITRPLRDFNTWRRSVREQFAERWMRFKLRAIRSYHRMQVGAPTLAWTIRRLLRPLFRSLNWLFLGHARSNHLPKSQSSQSQPSMPMAYQQVDMDEDFRPLVSIIVPNYNHGRFLRQRLDSIFSQSYDHFEVILLDDGSKDDSHSILESYRDKYPEKCRLIVNETNSGGVFYQWEKGLNLANGEIVWIAESDDWCSQDFLQTLVPYFRNEAIQLAYGKTIFMSGSGDEQIWTINEYLSDIDSERWHQAFVDTAHKIVGSAFAIKNIIPNVSSALFRNPAQLEVLKDPAWKKMRTCGDWVFYLHIIRGGMLAYSPDAYNYYRIHGANTSVNSYADDEFYVEHEQVARTVQRYYKVDAEVFERQKQVLISHWQSVRPSFTDEAFDDCYSIERIVQVAVNRAPNLLMVGYAFCSGGGETFAIQLANIMKGSDYNVTFLDCGQEPRNQCLRDSLRRDIPVVSDFQGLVNIARDFGIDIIHSHHGWVDSTILNLLPKNSQSKTVVTLHGMYETINDHDLREILPRLVERSARIIYVADKNLSALRKHRLVDKASLARIDNALDIVDVEPIPRGDLGIPEEAFVLTLVSRAMEEKGWAEAVEAVIQARGLCDTDIHLILLGDGPEYDRLLTDDLPQFIHLEGFKRNVRSYFAISQMGFLPSKFRGESFPLVIIECLQTGRPVLASAVGEVSYMLDSGDGLAGAVFELDDWSIDVPTLAQQIATLASDGDSYRQLQSRVAAAEKKFDPDVLARKHDAVYRQVAADSGV
jgi:glycosyltransferase involved in cell wall biosynthesis